MSKYTPGPWTIKEEDGDGACRYTDICKTWILDSEFRSNMAFIQAWYQEDDKNVFEEVRANTRLMAAAPDLLEALKQCEVMFRVFSTADLRKILPGTYKDILVVLAKAEGD